MATIRRDDLRNIAIIAHVDHGKTTLVDHLLKQSNAFRAHQQVADLVLDSNDLEREKGITILSKATAIQLGDRRINVIDTPGHADFSGEVERVIEMADGCLLLVDAAEGPLPQTRFVLRQALRAGLRPIVVLNKLDRRDARPAEVLEAIHDLFLELATDAEQLDFPVLYAVGREGQAGRSPDDLAPNLGPLFETIVDEVPAPVVDLDAPFRLRVAALAYDDHLGRIAIGRVDRGRVAVGQSIVRIGADGATTAARIGRMYRFRGIGRETIEHAEAGDIVALSGVAGVGISETLADPAAPEALPPIAIAEPTVQMTFGVSTSPFAGLDGQAITSRQLRARLDRELETNVALRVAETDLPDVFLTAGRGELHLAILIETMRREGMEFQVSRPEVIFHEEAGRRLEPFERVFIEVPDEAVGPAAEQLGRRRGQLENMVAENGRTRLQYLIPTRGLIGLRSLFLTLTRGEGHLESEFVGYQPYGGDVPNLRTGVLVASETGTAVSYGLENAQERGVTFIEPGTPVYEGMIVGQQPRDGDLNINVCKEKKQTNVRSSTAEIAIRLTPAVRMSLEACLEFLAEDELLEVTPKNLRLRKRYLSADDRYRRRRT
ncbi:MAG: translational GTPase TypA [Chloroflexi bacterium]|nr:translational GTPase TypA [Chloroflexota bacterium]